MEENEIFVILFLWLLISLVVGMVGNGKKIGYWGVFWWSVLLSPIIGIIVGVSSSKIDENENHPFKKHIELGKKSEYKGEIKESINHYMDGLYHLENDYKNITNKKWEEGRIKLIESYKLKVEDLKQKLI